MSDDTISASDFTSAESTLSGTPAVEPGAVSAELSAPVDAAAQPGEATTQPAATSPDPLSTAVPDDNTPGPRLKDHKQILENTRVKAAQEAQAQFDSQYGWAKQITPQEFESVRSIASHFASGDVEAGLQSLGAALRQDPAVDAKLRSYHARELARARQAPVEQQPQMVNVQLEDGSIVAMPRDPASWLDHQKQQWLAQVKQEFSPVTQTIERLQAERAGAERAQQIEHFTNTTYANVVTLPGMESKENQQLLAKDLAQAQVDPNDINAVKLALFDGYHRVVLPNLQTASRQAVLNDINRQAAASTVNPAQTSTRAPKSMAEMSIAEALQHTASQFSG